MWAARCRVHDERGEPNLLQLVRLFRESVMLRPAAASFRQGWQEAMTGQTLPVSELWEGIDAG